MFLMQDHIVYKPSEDALIKLNRIGFKELGDMNWHNHTGLLTVPIKIANQFKIPYVFYGEPFWDISGMFKPEDDIEFTKRIRIEYGMRGRNGIVLLKIIQRAYLQKIWFGQCIHLMMKLYLLELEAYL